MRDENVAQSKAYFWLGALLYACSNGSGGPDPSAIPDVPSVLDSGSAVALPVPEGVKKLSQELTTAESASAEDVRASHTVAFETSLGYDPLSATNLDRVLKPFFSEGAASIRAELAKTGFAVSGSPHSFQTFAQGYSVIYENDLPVFISADMVLEAIYRSHDKILTELEQRALRPRLERLLRALRAELVESPDTLSPETASDLNFYLGVAESLLHGEVDSREPSGVKQFYQAALSAQGEEERVLFGVKRRIDFSQFKPRGHYAGDAGLERYFRSMMWLGRIDFRLLETQHDGTQILRRKQVESAVALRKLLTAEAFADYRAIDTTLSAFVGEHDSMTIEDVDALLVRLGSPDGIGALDDATLAQAIVDGHFGEQRIASAVMRRSPSGPSTFPLNASFALFGQRYTVDSHVFSNVVYDRVPTRVVPNPLDVAFAALGNDHAIALLGDELESDPKYPGALSATRLVIDAHPSAYWEGSLYTNWMSALRTLSPRATPPSDLPSVARSEAWGRRVLNTQLASWAQLRHNNVLYAKQSYTSNAACEYPDAYVDPYPEFFEGIVRFAERAQALVAALDLDDKTFKSRLEDYFSKVAPTNRILAEMARAQRTGAPHSTEHLAFINRAVNAFINCDGTPLGHTGWYADLHFEPLQALEFDPSITDVHTDIGGALPVSRPPSVLHVGTGRPRLMVVTVDSCQGPRAYAGVVSAYHELLISGELKRLTDEEWKNTVRASTAPNAPWLEPILVR